MYLFLFLVVILVVSAVSAIIEEKVILKETLKMFVATSLGMVILAVVAFFLSR